MFSDYRMCSRLNSKTSTHNIPVASDDSKEGGDTQRRYQHWKRGGRERGEERER